MHRSGRWALPGVAALVAGLVLSCAPATTLPVRTRTDAVWLDTLDLSVVRQGWGKPNARLSVTENPLRIAGKRFTRGVGTHAHSVLHLELGGGSDRFMARVGVDDAAKGPGSVVFQVIADGRTVFDSGVMRFRDPAKAVDIPLAGVQRLLLLVTDAGDGGEFDHANWADARFLVSGQPPRPIVKPGEPFDILTPAPHPEPRINGPRVYGVRPGNPFLYRIPAQGQRPMTFAADGLPPGLSVDATSGIITGTNPPPGEYLVTLRAENIVGRAARPFRIVSGEALALTPPMGWNHWYAHYNRITDTMMREAADILVSSGLADVGYQYVNIDDCWMRAERDEDPRRNGPFRDAAGNLIPNAHFPDMKALADYIHSKGLKAGLYTSPGKTTCAGFAGALGHEERDARQFAAWGFDFLKYDWCSYGLEVSNPPTLEQMKQPYRQMGALLRQQPRDMLFNLCQYGRGDVWTWGAEVGGHAWRTSGDLGFELDRVFEVALKNAEYGQWQRPGAWNDPDYIQVGYVGFAPANGLPEPVPLTAGEQYAFMSLWSLMAAPLFYSGDLTRLDPFTLSVLANPEVIDINQDPLGVSARVVRLSDTAFLMVKDLEDGSKAVGLCNRGEVAQRISASWAHIGVAARQVVRDVWRQQDLGAFEGAFESMVGRRAVVLVRLRAER